MYAHAAHCNVIHDGPEDCPPRCDNLGHATGRPCPGCGSTVAPPPEATSASSAAMMAAVEGSTSASVALGTTCQIGTMPVV